MSDDFWQRENYRKEYAADLFAAFYGFGKPLAHFLDSSKRRISFLSHPFDAFDEYLTNLIEKRQDTKTHPSSVSRVKRLLQSSQTKPGFINVPHYERTKVPVWTERPYAGPKKIDISATPIYKKTVPLKLAPGQPDYSFRPALQNVAAKATYILKKIPK